MMQIPGIDCVSKSHLHNLPCNPWDAELCHVILHINHAVIFHVNESTLYGIIGSAIHFYPKPFHRMILKKKHRTDEEICCCGCLSLFFCNLWIFSPGNRIIPINIVATDSVAYLPALTVSVCMAVCLCYFACSSCDSELPIPSKTLSHGRLGLGQTYHIVRAFPCMVTAKKEIETKKLVSALKQLNIILFTFL